MKKFTTNNDPERQLICVESDIRYKLMSDKFCIRGSRHQYPRTNHSADSVAVWLKCDIWRAG